MESLHEASPDATAEEGVPFCRFCPDVLAVAEFSMDQGCFCFPEDRRQALCLQHIEKATPLGSMVVSRVFDPDAWEWYNSPKPLS